MSIELRQQIKMTQQLSMTPQLQMAIRLLQLSRLELMETINQEMEENPVLEEVQETLSMTDDSNPGTEEKVESDQKMEEVTIDERLPDDADWHNYLDEYNTPGRTSYEAEEKEAPKYEAFVAKSESLSDHLLWQLLMTSPTPEEEQVGSMIVGNLTRDGYLDTPLEDISAATGVDIKTVNRVLEMLQSFDPVGVCARNLEECLLIQANYFNVDSPIIEAIIRKHLNHLQNRNYKAIARATKTNVDTVAAAVEIIKGFEPRPGRAFNNETPQYITPDIYLYKMDDDYVIVLNDDGMPRLQVSDYYQRAISKGGGITGSDKDYMQEKIRSASWLIKSIQQRQKTIYRVMESILKFQRDFFDKGVSYLRPLVLRDIAEDIEMHESTISRVTTNKYAYTPQGTYELKYFFSHSISQGEDAVASATVQEQIRRIIDAEDPKKPYSDEKICQILKADNIDIARRTVAKYRETMRILPSSKRKRA